MKIALTGPDFIFQILAGDEARTHDIYLGKVTLYQLSYTRKNQNSSIKGSPF